MWFTYGKFLKNISKHMINMYQNICKHYWFKDKEIDDELIIKSIEELKIRIVQADKINFMPNKFIKTYIYNSINGKKNT
jgi:hypothetical protein